MLYRFNKTDQVPRKR